MGLDGILIGLGRRYATRPATVFCTGDHVIVFIDDQFVRDLVIDRSRLYQPKQR